MRILIILFCLLLSAPAWAETFAGQVIGISDGDTITVLTDARQQVKIRLYGVDCPEARQAFGSRARQFASAQVFGKRVSVEVAGRDRYGRTVGIVAAPGGSVLNRELVAGGMAWVYPAYCTLPVCAGWQRDEAAAREARRGLWAEASPVPPWDFRRGGGAPRQATAGQPAVAGGYSGNVGSGIFHAAGCRYFNCKRCTARFPSRNAAIRAGYRPCKVCRP